MEIVFLNTWGGRVSESLMDFFKNNKDVDVFCLQEVWNVGSEKSIDSGEMSNLFSDIGNVLDSHEKIFAPADKDGDYGLAIYFKKSLLPLEDGNIMIHDKEEYFPDLDVTSPARNLQYLTLQVEDRQKLTILNFHGLWTGGGKDDTHDRLRQSECIVSFLKTINHSFVIGGDFNLNPDTESIRMLETIGLRNLIKENGVTSTRTSFYKYENKFADYVFVTKGVEIKNFSVLSDEVSDHAPLMIELLD